MNITGSFAGASFTSEAGGITTNASGAFVDSYFVGSRNFGLYTGSIYYGYYFIFNASKSWTG